jgi:hypothetical protein
MIFNHDQGQKQGRIKHGGKPGTAQSHHGTIHQSGALRMQSENFLSVRCIQEL